MTWASFFIVLSNIIIRLDRDGSGVEVDRVKLTTFKLLFETITSNIDRMQQFECSQEFLEALNVS